MNSSIEMEIVRLVKEIAEDEMELVSAEKEASLYSTESLRQKYLLKAQRCKDSMERKLNLLKILKS